MRWCGVCSSNNVGRQLSAQYPLLASPRGEKKVAGYPLSPHQNVQRAPTIPPLCRERLAPSMERAVSLRSTKVGKAAIATPKGWPPGVAKQSVGVAAAQGSTADASSSVAPSMSESSSAPSAASAPSAPSAPAAAQDVSEPTGRGGTPVGGRRLASKSKPFWERELQRHQDSAQVDGTGAPALANGDAPAPANGDSSKQHRRTSSEPLVISPGLLNGSLESVDLAPRLGASPASRHTPVKRSVFKEHLRGGADRSPAGSLPKSPTDAGGSWRVRGPRLPFSKSFSKMVVGSSKQGEPAATSKSFNRPAKKKN